MDVAFAYNKIFDLLENEDASLNLLNPNAGIFFAPELYIVFQIGRLLKTHELKVFGEKVEWMRETNFGNGGATDLIFLKENELFLFEFKMAATSHSYLADVEKLKKVDLQKVQKRKGFEKVTKIQKYFVAIIDVFSEQGSADPRLLKIAENSIGLSECVGDFKMFKTNYDAYKKDNSCFVAIWAVE